MPARRHVIFCAARSPWRRVVRKNNGDEKHVANEKGISIVHRDEKAKNFEETGGTEVDEKFCSRREAKWTIDMPDEFAMRREASRAGRVYRIPVA